MADKIAKASGGRPAVGSMVWADAETKTRPLGVRVTKANGKRRSSARPRHDAGGSDRAHAHPRRPRAARHQRGDRGHGCRVRRAMACDRKAQGIASALSHDRGRLRKHVLPILGPLDVRTFGREDVERVVADLTERSVSTKTTRIICSGRRPATSGYSSRRCAATWPTRRTALYAYATIIRLSAWLRRIAVTCARRTISTPTSSAPRRMPPDRCRLPHRLRGGRLHVHARGRARRARTGDVDLEHDVIHVTRSIDRETRKAKSTKSGTTRRIPIERELRPVLEQLFAQRAPRRASTRGASCGSLITRIAPCSSGSTCSSQG